jgi:hypothetical protein
MLGEKETEEDGGKGTGEFGDDCFAYGLGCACYDADEAILFDCILGSFFSFKQVSSFSLTSFPSARYGEKCSESN